MSFGIAIFLSEKSIPTKEYSAFVDDCSSILGTWHIHELSPFNLNADEEVHEWALLDSTNRYSVPKKDVHVWVSLERDNFIKKYGRSRRKVFWKIYVETKAGRNIWSLAIQLLIPLRAFEHFPNIIVVADPDRVFLHPKNYESFVKEELVSWYGAEAVEEIGLVDSGAAAPNRS
jgi:hypothetical protein